MRHPLRLAVATVLLIAVLLVIPCQAWAQQVWEVDTYGNGSMLRAVFEGISTFTGAGGGLSGALKLAGLVGLLALLVGMAGGALRGGNISTSFPHAAIVAGAVATLSTSVVNVAIVDKVAATSEIVQGIPLPIAIIGHFTSAVGSRITQQIEQVILPVDVERFMSHGLGWGPRVTQATLDASIQDPNLRQDLDAYIQICLWESFQSGVKTAETLLNRSDVDQIFGDTNPAIEIILPSQAQNPPANQACPDAWVIINAALDQHAQSQNVLQYLAMQLNMPFYGDVPSVITDVANDLLKTSITGTEALKLRFALNRLLPAVQYMSAIGGQSAMVTAWALAEAQAQQTSAWLTTGLLLQQVLPVFHAALEFLFYGFLLIGLPLLMVMPRMLVQIIQTALWLQLWPVAYVFGNLFLYTQVQKVSLLTGDGGQGLGLSMAATPAIQGSIQSAYAASGFPIMIGVTMLGGMIFGGGYALQRAVMQGPWQAGGAFGSAAALGNISAGNVGLEQRNLAPMTQTIRDGGLDTRYGPSVDRPVYKQFRAGSYTNKGMSYGEFSDVGRVNGGPGSPEVRLGGDNKFAWDPGSGRLIPGTDIGLTAETRKAALTRGGQAYDKASETVETEASRLENAKARNLERTLQTTGSREASEQYGVSEGTRDAFEKATQRTIADTIQRGEAGEEVRSHAIRDLGEANVKAGGALQILGVGVGADGRLQVQALFERGENYRTTLSKDTSNKVLSQAQDTLSRTSEYQALRSEVERHGETSARNLGFSDVQRATESYSKAVSKRDTVNTMLEATQAAETLVGTKQAHLFVQALWDQRHPGVNMYKEFEADSDKAKSFAAWLKGSLSTPEGYQELATKAVDYLKQTGQYDQYFHTAEWIAGQQPKDPSAAGLTPVRDDLAERGYQEPATPIMGQVEQGVQTRLQGADAKLAPDRQAIEREKGRLDRPPTVQEVERGIKERELKTHGGPLTAGAQAAGEIPAGLGRDVIAVGAKVVGDAGKIAHGAAVVGGGAASVVKGVGAAGTAAGKAVGAGIYEVGTAIGNAGQQLGAAFKSVHEENKKLTEEGGEGFYPATP